MDIKSFWVVVLKPWLWGKILDWVLNRLKDLCSSFQGKHLWGIKLPRPPDFDGVIDYSRKKNPDGSIEERYRQISTPALKELPLSEKEKWRPSEAPGDENNRRCG